LNSELVLQEEVIKMQRSLAVAIATFLLLLLSLSITATRSGHAAPLDPRKVVVTVRVVDEGGNKISGAHISVYQGEQFLGQGESDARGIAQIDVLVNADRVVILALEISKPGMETKEHALKLGTSFPARLPIEEVSLVAGVSKASAVLTVKVVDPQTKPVSNARINVFRGYFTGTFIVVPFDYQKDTNVNGIATFDIPVRPGQGLDLTLEVSREDLSTERRPLQYGSDFPPQLPLQTFVLQPRNPNDSRTFPLANIKVNVEDDAGNNLEGALVAVTSDALTPSQRNAPHQRNTGPDGSATVGIELMSADPVENIRITVSKPGYKEFKKVELVNNKDGKAVGKTVELAPISLVRLPDAAFEVRITVLDGQTKRGVPDAEVILEGPDYATQTTDGNGVATVPVDKPGSYKVRISQPFYEKINDVEVRLLPQDKHPDVPAFQLRLKPTKDAAGDTIDIVVLAKDSIDADSKTHPLRGAAVSDGRGTTYTDENGRASLKGAYEGSQQITATAKDYQPVTRRVGINKLFPLSQGTGSATFTLDPALTDKTPIRLIVEVHDRAVPQNKLSQAFVYLFFVEKDNKETPVGSGARSNENGEASFTLEDSDRLPLSKLRSGLRIYGKTNRHKLTPSDVIADQLLPSLEARRITIFLERDWDALIGEVQALEAKVNAWEFGNVKDPERIPQFIEKATSELDDAHSLFTEFDALAKTFPELTYFGSQSLCTKVANLQLDIRSCESKVNTKASELEQALKDASAMAPRCSSPAEAESLRASYRKAIQLLGEMGKLRNQAVRDHDDLSLLPFKASAAERALAQMKDKTTMLQTLMLAAKQNQSSATVYVNRYQKGSSTSVQLSLKAELAVLTVKVEGETGVPADLLQRISNMRGALTAPTAAGATPLPPIVNSAPIEIERLEESAAAKVAEFDRSVCQVITLDDAVEGIKKKVDDAGVEVAFANDIPKLADVCSAKAANGPGTSTTPNSAENKPDDKNSSSTGPSKDKKPTTVEDDPGIKIAQPGKPNSQDTSSGGFWESAKAGKKKVENAVNNKPANQTNPATTGETSANTSNTNTATNKTGNNPPPAVEKLPEDNTQAAANKTASKTNKSTTTAEENPETYVDNPPLSKRPASRSANKPSDVEKIPETASTRTGASKRPATKPSTEVEEIPDTAVKPAATRGSVDTSDIEKKPGDKKPTDPNKPSKWEKAGKILGAIAAATNNQNQGTTNPGTTNTGTSNPGTTNTGSTGSGTAGSSKEWMIRNQYRVDLIRIGVRGGQVTWIDRQKYDTPARQGCTRAPALFSGSFNGKSLAVDWTLNAEFCPSVGKYYSTSIREACTLQLNSDNSLSGTCTDYATDWGPDRKTLVPKAPTTGRADAVCVICQ
jgi:hypothetical protein